MRGNPVTIIQAPCIYSIAVLDLSTDAVITHRESKSIPAALAHI